MNQTNSFFRNLAARIHPGKPFRSVYTTGFLITVVVLAAVDIITKYMITSSLSHEGSKPIVEGVLNFHLVFNTGGIFGTFRGRLIPTTIVMFVAIMVLIYIYWKDSENLGTRFGWMLIMGGALGNFTDKLFKKTVFHPTNIHASTGWTPGFEADPSNNTFVGVVDFLQVYLPEFLCGVVNNPDCSWYIFNVADMYISVGVSILILSIIRQGWLDWRQKTAAKTTA